MAPNLLSHIGVRFDYIKAQKKLSKNYIPENVCTSFCLFFLHWQRDFFLFWQRISFHCFPTSFLFWQLKKNNLCRRGIRVNNTKMIHEYKIQNQGHQSQYTNKLQKNKEIYPGSSRGWSEVRANKNITEIQKWQFTPVAAETRRSQWKRFFAKHNFLIRTWCRWYHRRQQILIDLKESLFSHKNMIIKILRGKAVSKW